MDYSPFLLDLRAHFNASGFDIRDVGGAVRDTLLGFTPKDRDFCTDADPDQQIEIYKKAHIRYVLTGLQHGTITVVSPDGETYEITSLRVESDHDGRHATVTFTDNWEADLGRRDFTINAMAMDFDGKLYDPFGGESDLKKGLVRFVGDADQRIKEDYLRILRYFRFIGRFSIPRSFLDERAIAAITANAQGLEGNDKGLKPVSVERIWAEMSKILVGSNASWVLRTMMDAYVGRHIGLRRIDPNFEHRPGITPPAALVLAQGDNAIALAENWKMSNEEARLIGLLMRNKSCYSRDGFRKLLAIDKISRDDAIQLCLVNDSQHHSEDILTWDIPVFPVSGDDLIATGLKPSPKFSVILGALKQAWVDSGYLATKTDLLSTFN